MDNKFKDIKKLLQLKKNGKFIVNGKYECTIKNDNAFSTFTKNKNCPSYSSYAMVKVLGHDKLAKVDVLWSLDLVTSLTCSICFYSSSLKDEISSMTTVTKLQFL